MKHVKNQFTSKHKQRKNQFNYFINNSAQILLKLNSNDILAQ